MSDRRQQTLDAAIAVLGTRGLRALTHRAVDAQASLPEGSTSNGYRTRDALVGAVLDRLVEIETQVWQRLVDERAAPPASPEEFAQLIAAMVHQLTGAARHLTLARHAVFHEAAFQPELQGKIRAARDRLAAWGIPWVARLGSTDPRTDYLSMLALVDGLVAIQLACPDPDFDPTPAIRTMLAGITAH
ncbi:TetR/AcrR family transcriptional regulator [Catellatospora tritici]|uniref:TetR/AcrR family transcriptional regulator n=1 Tax=Catellatospora tritici TaxID=2851566 RepID=UPI001C2D725D|nr:TetR/AcrR family transcriptional regulator [Catellatospora tritici]MBV1852865.1 TetR family transcriptional regulator [Catellatospora tritici]